MAKRKAAGHQTSMAPGDPPPRVNRLFYGDNLKLMERMPPRSVDLIYLDPPFKSNQTYNLLYRQMTGLPVPEQAEAFFDTWEMDAQKEHLAATMPALMLNHGIEDEYVQFWKLWMTALRKTQPHLLAYLIYMVPRLLWMKTLLKPNGSIYLHCDPTASHYIKVMMDAIFDHQNFRNEIVWKRTSAHSSAKRFGPVHDTILYYTRGKTYTWNPAFQPIPQETIDQWYNNIEPGTNRRFNRADLTAAGTRTGPSGAPWRGIDPTERGRHWAIPRFLKDLTIGKDTQEALGALDAAGRLFWPKRAGGMPMLKRYLDESTGTPAQDVITDISPLNNVSSERLGYPTQKPIALLKRLILASTNEGDVVFDPFCGCGTTIYAAHETKRHWIGCDIAILAIKLIKEVLGEKYRLSERADYEVAGIPASVEQAEALFAADPFQFQNWAVERVGGFPTKKKGADKGIDGRLYFETRQGLKSMVLSVKGGTVHPTAIRDLVGVLSTEPEAELAGFISLKPPTKAMKDAASAAGTYEYNGVQYPKIQLLTITDIVAEKREFYSPTKLSTRISTGQAVLPLH